jgi:hypothetical protein
MQSNTRIQRQPILDVFVFVYDTLTHHSGHARDNLRAVFFR